MFEQKIEDIIGEVLIGDAQKNALDFVAYLRSSEMQFEREKGYWEDKYYWGIKYANKFVCFILINSEGKTDPESWTIWSDDSGSNTFGDCQLDEHIKEILWKNVDICGNCGGCSHYKNPGGTRKTIFGKEFDNVCITTMRFTTPDTKTVECVKKMVEIRKNDILKNF
jgi:hypothetical protein